MQQLRFEQNLKAASFNTLMFSRDRVVNKLALNFLYRIQPEAADPRVSLHPWENELRQARLTELERLLTFEEVVIRLWNNEFVPAFIHISVYKSKPHQTILNLCIDNHYVKDDLQMKYPFDGAPPFHVVLDKPVYMGDDDESKFDANWRHHKWLLKYRMWKRKNELRKRIKNVAWWKQV